jgi:hypothetical protein
MRKCVQSQSSAREEGEDARRPSPTNTTRYSHLFLRIEPLVFADPKLPTCIILDVGVLRLDNEAAFESELDESNLLK